MSNSYFAISRKLLGGGRAHETDLSREHLASAGEDLHPKVLLEELLGTPIATCVFQM